MLTDCTFVKSIRVVDVVMKRFSMRNSSSTMNVVVRHWMIPINSASTATTTMPPMPSHISSIGSSSSFTSCWMTMLMMTPTTATTINHAFARPVQGDGRSILRGAGGCGWESGEGAGSGG